MYNVTGLNLFIYAAIAAVLYFATVQFLGTESSENYVDSSREESESLLLALSDLEDSNLRTLSDNITLISSLSGLDVGKIVLISDPNVNKDGDDYLQTNSKLHSGGMDRIGEFRDLIVRVEGDPWQQLYVLNFIYNNFRDFTVIREFEGNERFINIGVRVYGWGS